MNFQRKGNALLKNLALFFVANFMPRAITFFMVPLYTFCLTTEEYGVVDLLHTTVQLALPFFTLQIQDAMLRFSMDDETDPSDVLSVGLRIIVSGGILLSFITVLVTMSGWLDLPWSYVCFFLVSYFLSAIKNITTYFCRGIEEIKTVTLANVAVTLTTVVCNLVFLLGFKWGVNAYLFALAMGNFSGIAIIFFKAKLIRYIKFVPGNTALQKTIIAFSVPMVFSALSWWLNTSLDKYILRFFEGTAAVGLFSVAYKIPTILSLFGVTFANAYSISVIKDLDVEDRDGFLGKSYSTIFAFFAMGCSGLMILNLPLAKILFAKDFFVAWKYVPMLLVAAVVSQMSLVCEQYYVAIKKTKIISATALVGAGVNLAGNLILIPLYSGAGAAIATILSFGTAWMLRYLCLKRFVAIKDSAVRDAALFFGLLIQMWLACFGNKFLAYQICVFVVLMLLSRKELLGVISFGADALGKLNVLNRKRAR